MQIFNLYKFYFFIRNTIKTQNLLKINNKDYLKASKTE